MRDLRRKKDSVLFSSCRIFLICRQSLDPGSRWYVLHQPLAQSERNTRPNAAVFGDFAWDGSALGHVFQHARGRDSGTRKTAGWASRDGSRFAIRGRVPGESFGPQRAFSSTISNPRRPFCRQDKSEGLCSGPARHQTCQFRIFSTGVRPSCHSWFLPTSNVCLNEECTYDNV